MTSKAELRESWKRSVDGEFLLMDQNQTLMVRIADLEAELTQAETACGEEVIRREKAEAEVERLRAERDFWKKGIETHPWTKPGDMEKHQAAFEMIYAAFKEATP